MKIAVLNLIGNIGKTTVSSSLLSPRMPEAKFFSVETTNSGAEANGIDVEKLKGKQFGDLLDQLLRIDSAIVDVGASNADDFLKHLQKFGDSHEEFDYFVIPITSDSRAQEESLKTVDILRLLGVDKKRIRTVFNRVEVDDFDDVPSIFAPVFQHSSENKSCIVNHNATIFDNEVFGMLRDNELSMQDIISDDTDYRALRKEAKTPEELDSAIAMIKIKSLTKTANKNLDDVYKVLFK